jgi:sporulation protein YlmC with PRC-barrel domain
MESSQSSRRVNDEGNVALFLFLISTMNGRVESFMIVRKGERWPSPAMARCMITVGLYCPHAGGQISAEAALGILERSLSPEVMLTRSSLDVPPAETAVRSWAPTPEPLAVSPWAVAAPRPSKLLHQEGTMAGTDAPGVMTGKPLIESDRVEGTAVYDRNGNRIGSVKRLMIDKKTGQVAYTVLSFGGFLGLGSEEYTIPWNKLDYDTSLGGFKTDIAEDQIRGAPSFYRERDYDWSDRQRERELHDYWNTPYYWGI